MPRTVDLINYMKLQASNWNRDGEEGLLPLLNEAQNLLMQQETYQTIKYVNGEFPGIVTTDGVFEYDVASDVWRVEMILFRTPISSQLQVIIEGEYGLEPNILIPIKKYIFNGIEYYRFPQVSTVDKSYDNACKVRFNLNPGSTTEDFVYLGYTLPTQIINENIQPTLPERYHMIALLPSAMELLQAIQNNTWDMAVDKIMNKYKPMIRYELNDGEQGETHEIQRRTI